MIERKKHCGQQSDCHLHKLFPDVLACCYSLRKDNIIYMTGGETGQSKFDESYALTLFNRALTLSQDGYTSDAIACYSNIIELFRRSQIKNKELMKGALHNCHTLKKIASII